MRSRRQAVADLNNPHNYEPEFTIEHHRDELIDRLGAAIRCINEREAKIAAIEELLQMIRDQHAGYAPSEPVLCRSLKQGARKDTRCGWCQRVDALLEGK
jgi:hypothetical protein